MKNVIYKTLMLLISIMSVTNAVAQDQNAGDEPTGNDVQWTTIELSENERLADKWQDAGYLKIKGKLNYEDLKFFRRGNSATEGTETKTPDLTKIVKLDLSEVTFEATPTNANGSRDEQYSYVTFPTESTGDATPTPFYIMTATGLPAVMCQGMANLEEIILPNGCTHIGAYAFYGCKKMTDKSFKIASTIVDCDFSNFIGFGIFAFSECEITKFTIPSSYSNEELVTALFKNCKSLTSVTLNDKITKISGNVFDGCSALTKC